LHQRFHQAANTLWRNLDSQLKITVRALNTVSPLATLNRGYAIVQKYDDQQIIRDAGQLSSGDEVLTRFSHGQARCTVNEIFKRSDYEKDV
jgi:exodeoxyribonuclease VII large subunit